jgi:Uma2 family endonuclease
MSIKTVPSNRPGKILRSDRKRWTYEDLRRMPESQERNEIIDGVLHMSPSAHVRRHQRVVGNLYALLRPFVEARGLGEVFISPADVVAAPGRVVQPDLFFVAAERLHIVGAFVDGVPDLTIEVVSVSSVEYDRVTKFNLYEDIGVREYWLVDPEDQSLEVHVLRGGRFELLGRWTNGGRAHSAILDGLDVEVDAVFR